MESDQRFSAIQRDPRFRLLSKRERKVKIDKRFTKMFTDRNFKLKYTVDKRGRPVDLSSNDHLQRYYELSSSECGSSDEEETTDKQPVCNEQDAGRASSERPIKVRAAGKPLLPTEREQHQTAKEKRASTVVDDRKASRLKTAAVENTCSKGLHKNSKKNVVATPTSDGRKTRTSERPEKSPSVEASKHRGHFSARTSNARNIEVAESSLEDEVISAEEDLKEVEEEQDSVDDEVSETDDRSSDDNSGNRSGASGQSSGLSSKPLERRTLAEGRSNSLSSGHDKKHAKLLAADGPDYARGEGALSSSDSDSDDSFYDDSALGEETSAHDDHYWGEMDKDAGVVEEPTCRLAVCNMDWDRIKAIDLMVLLNSFKPADGIVKSVKIFPSDYGLERMKEEERSGPKELNAAGSLLSKDEAKLSLKEIEKKQTEWLRLYQLNRLRYYYAVVECDSTATASHIYEQCDGLEYESSSTKLDLRFIPNEMTFDDREATCEASSIADLSTYKPSLFVNTALNQSKVDCTWDETSKDRLMVTNRKFKKEDIEAMDLKVYSYVASSSESEGETAGNIDNDTDKQKSDDSYVKKNKKGSAIARPASDENDSKDDDGDDEEAALTKYRRLLQDIEQKESGSRGPDDVEMEITWEPGLKDDAEALVEHKVAEADGLTVWDKYLEKRRDKKKQKLEEKKLAKVKDEGESSVGKQHSKRKRMKGKPELELDDKEAKERAELSLLVGSDEEDKKHFSMKKIIKQENLSKKKKRKLAEKHDKTDNFEVDLNDPRFSAVYTSHLYNIDPSAQEFKKTKASIAIIEEKLKRRARSEQDGVRLPQLPASQQPLTGSDPGLAMLVKSVKAKAKNFKQQRTA